MGVRIPRPGRKTLVIGLILLVAVAVGYGVYTKLNKNDSKASTKTQSKTQPKTVAEVAKTDAVRSMPSDDYTASLESVAASSQDATEKYNAYFALCNAYNSQNKLDKAKASCDKAVEFGTQAKIDSTKLDAVKSLDGFMKNKLDSQKAVTSTNTSDEPR